MWKLVSADQWKCNKFWIEIATTHEYEAGLDKKLIRERRELQLELAYAWISMLSFMPYFPQSKMKRQPGICDYYKRQKNCLLVNNNKDYKKHNKYHLIRFCDTSIFDQSRWAAREYPSLLASSFVVFTRGDGVGGAGIPSRISLSKVDIKYMVKNLRWDQRHIK